MMMPFGLGNGVHVLASDYGGKAKGIGEYGLLGVAPVFDRPDGQRPSPHGRFHLQ